MSDIEKPGSEDGLADALCDGCDSSPRGCLFSIWAACLKIKMCLCCGGSQMLNTPYSRFMSRPTRCLLLVKAGEQAIPCGAQGSPRAALGSARRCISASV